MIEGGPLAQTEEYAKSQPRKLEEALLTVKLANPDRLANGWSVSINDGEEEMVSGDSKSFRLTPGSVIVRVRATLKAGKDDASTNPFATEIGEVLAAGPPLKVITVTLPAKHTN